MGNKTQPTKTTTNPKDNQSWYVMRSLKRSNAKISAYQELSELGLEVFVPTSVVIIKEKGKSLRKEVPCITDLIFVKSDQETLDPIVKQISTLQYRFERGGYCKPMTVPSKEMERFITAIKQSNTYRYLLPEEISSQMIGKRVRIVSGPLTGYEGNLLTIRGSHHKRLLIELPHLLSVAIEVSAEFIEFIP